MHEWLRRKLSWYNEWHQNQEHSRVHWLILSIFSTTTLTKVLITALAIGGFAALSTNRLTAADKTWTDESGWVEWTKDGISNTTAPGSLTLNSTGLEWNIAASPTNKTLHALWGTSNNNIWAVGNQGTIIHYDGTSWSSASSPTGDNLYAIWGTSSSNIWAVGGPNNSTTGTVLHYDGTSWSLHSQPERDDLFAIWGSSSTDIYATGGYPFHPTAAHSDGTSWIESYDLQIAGRSIWGTSASNVWVVGDAGRITHYDGATWGYATSNISNPLHSMWGDSASNIWAVGKDGTIIHYDGVSWGTVTSNTTSELYSTIGITASDIYAVGTGGTILHYNGSTWSTVTSPTTNLLRSVWGSANNDLWAVGDNGRIIHTNPAYVSSGTATTIYTPTPGKTQHWDAATVQKFDNGQTASVEYSTDISCATGFTTDITSLEDSESICVKISLSTNNNLVTPRIEAVTITFSEAIALPAEESPQPTPSPETNPNTDTPLEPLEVPTSSPALSQAPSPNSEAAATATATPAKIVTPNTTSTSMVSPKSSPTLPPSPTPVATTDQANTAEVQPVVTPSSKTPSCKTNCRPTTTPIASPAPTDVLPFITRLILGALPPDSEIPPFLIIIATTLVGLISLSLFAPNTAQGLINLVNTLLNLPNLFSSTWFDSLPFFVTKKDRRPWGVARDSITEKPLPNTKVSLMLHEGFENKKIIEDIITDKQGRFGFLANNGTYSVTTQRNGYTFPSKRKLEQYQGTPFSLKESTTIQMDLYLDRNAFQLNLLYIVKKITAFLDMIHLPLLIIGTSLTLFTAITYPLTLRTIILLIVYLFLWIIEFFSLGRSHNTVQFTDEHGQPLPFTIVRVSHGVSGKIVANKVTDQAGEIYLLLPAGRYILSVPSPLNPLGSNIEIVLPQGVAPRHIRIKVNY